VRALNDDGKLGTVTKAMLKAQATRLGRLTTSSVGRQQPHYQLMRQLDIIKSSGVIVETPRSCKEDKDAYAHLLSR